jgi:uncharacterized protein YjbI with pentapeptide repeats
MDLAIWTQEKIMADQEQLETLRSWVESWNRWRKKHPKVQIDLSEANLTGADLVRANLSRADLSEANLSEAGLSGADLSEADLREADLSRANLRGTDLSQANLILAELNETDLKGAVLIGTQINELTQIDAKWRQVWEIVNRGAGGLGLSQANLSRADLSGADLKGADLSRADLRRATLTDTNLSQANLTGCSIYGISAWKLNLEGAIQTDLVISDEDESIITVDNIEVAQFIYLLLNHKNLRNVLDTVTERGVLILGRFGDGGLEMLQAIAAKLRELKYLPIIFDFEKPEARNYTETIKTLAGLSRFVIADLSGPSVPQELYATVPHFKIPFVPIIEKGA